MRGYDSEKELSFKVKFKEWEDSFCFSIIFGDTGRVNWMVIPKR